MESQEQQAQSKEQIAPMAPSDEQQRGSKRPIKLFVSRGYTVVVLLISIILLFTVKNSNKDIPEGNIPEKKNPTDSHNPPPPPNNKPPTFKISDLGSVRSVLTASVIGSACNLFQLGMLIYCMYTGKDMTQNKYNIFFDYYSDKVVSLLLAASAGAGIGAMLDIKQVLKPSFKTFGSFFSLGQISTTLVATTIVSASVSSTSSAVSMQEYKKTIQRGEKAVGVLGPWATKVYNFCCMRCC